MQEVLCKDVKHCFSILQSKWKIIQSPIHQWDLNTIKDILMTCVIMHKVIIEDEIIGAHSTTHNPMSWRCGPMIHGLNFEDYVS